MREPAPTAARAAFIQGTMVVALAIVVTLSAAPAWSQADGDPCSADGECDSTHCVDGVCCNNSCDCGVCNIGISLGFCVADPAGSPGSPSCAPYLCDGTSTLCPSTCTVDADCSSGAVCNAAQQCVRPDPLGAPALSPGTLALVALICMTLGALGLRNRRSD